MRIRSSGAGLVAALCLLAGTASGAPDVRRIAGVEVEILELDVPVLDVVGHPGGGLALLALAERIDVEALEEAIEIAVDGGVDMENPRQETLGNRRLLRWDDDGVSIRVDDAGPGPDRLFRRGDELWWSVDADDASRAVRLRAADPAAAPETVPGEWIDLALHERQGLLAAGARADVGRLTLLGDDLRERATIPLPLEARRRGDAIELRGSPVHVLGAGGPGEPATWIVGPRAVDDRRLQVWRLDPETGERTEIWCRLPGPEELGGHRIVELAGRPALAAWTNSAEKLGVFEKLALRVWILEPDRTRAGRRPVLEHDTATRRWFRPDVRTADFDGDGRDELVVSQPRGMGGNELLVEVFPVSPSGRIGDPRSTDFDAPGAEWDFGDVDGDGTPDLIVLDREALTVRRGLAEHRRKAFENRPFVEIPTDDLPRVAAPPGAEDRDDGGSLELHVLPDDAGGSRIVVVRTRIDSGSLVLRLRPGD